MWLQKPEFAPCLPNFVRLGIRNTRKKLKPCACVNEFQIFTDNLKISVCTRWSVCSTHCHILFMSHMYDYITGIRVINSFSCVSAGGWTHPERLSEWQSKEGALISLLFLPAQILFVCHLSINLSFCSPLLTAVPILAARRGRLVGQCSSLITRLSTSPAFIALYCKRWNLGHWELEKQATVTQRWPKGAPVAVNNIRH